jgi:hypothetical protein
MVWDADVNNDLLIDSVDIGIVRMSYRTANPTADIDHSGVVDSVDIGYTRKYAFTEVVGTPKWDYEEKACFEETNRYRATPAEWENVLDDQGNIVEPDRSRGPLPPLARSYRLSQATQWMAQDQADHQTLEHTDSTGRDMGARIVAYFPEAAFGFMGETGLGTDGGGQPASGKNSCRRWQLSPGHNTILLSDYASIGIGHAISTTTGPLPNDFQHRWYADFTTVEDTYPWPS